MLRNPKSMELDQLDFVDGFRKYTNSDVIREKRVGKPTFCHCSLAKMNIASFNIFDKRGE